MSHRILIAFSSILLGYVWTGCAETNPPAATDAGLVDDPLDHFFSPTIHNIQVTLTQDSIDDLISEPKVYTHARVTIDQTHHEDVGLRLKGNAGSFIPWGGDYPEISGDGNGNPGKSAFIIDFNRWVSGNNHLSLKKLTVNNLVQDPSCLHEFLGYSLFRGANIPASRSGWAMVTMNAQLKGIYALIETPDNSGFLNDHFGSDNGNLYEGEYGTDFSSPGFENFDQDNGADESKTDLQAVVSALDGIPEGADPLPVLEQYFDIRDYLDFAATEIYLGHWDGYASSANNYAVYHNPIDDMWTFLPWGLDQLFEHNPEFGGVISGPGPIWDGGGRVHQLCFRSTQCRQLLAESFEDLFTRIDEIDLKGLAEEARTLVEDQAILEATDHGDPDLTHDALDQIFERIDNRAEQMAAWIPCLTGGTVDNDADTYDGCDEDCDDENPQRHPGAAELCNFIDDDCNGIIDDPMECPKCLDEIGPGGIELSFCFEPLTFGDAQQYCVDRGQSLVSVHSEEQWEFSTFGMLDHFGIFEAWTGLNDQAAEGEFTWIDGTALDYQRWGPDAPAPDGPDCVVSSPEGWRDIQCAETKAFVCLTP